jgi:Tfp pilus assembly protein PilX
VIVPTLKESQRRVTRVPNERGIALAVAVFALVVMGALVAGIFFAGRLEQQTGQNGVYAAQASEAAEAGLSRAISSQTPQSMLAMAVDPVSAPAMTTTPLGANASYSTGVRRLTNELWLVQSLGSRNNASGGQLAQRTLGQLIRLNEAGITMSAGLTALGDVKLSGGAQITGIDAVPPAWATAGISCPPTADQAGVRFNLGTVTGADQAAGVPATELDPTLTAGKMQRDFDELKALATLVVTDGNPAATAPQHTGTPAKCDTSKQTNWGEPTVQTDPCFDYFPIIYHRGDLKLQGDRGQGILLVEGNLTITGSMVFYGPVYITGTLSAAGNSNQGAKFYGGVIAGNVALDDLTKLTGGAAVDYSSCAIKRALQNSATPTALNERSWMQLYN